MLHNRAGAHILDFVHRQPLRRADQFVEFLRGELCAHFGLACFQHQQDFLNLVSDFVAGGQGHLQHGDLFFQFGGQFEDGREEDDRASGALQARVEVAQQADDPCVREVRVEVFEYDQRVVLQAQ
jgi:hypothetical protein